MTNAGALIADESPIRWSRLFCTRWSGLNKNGGTIDAFDDAEYSGSVLPEVKIQEELEKISITVEALQLWTEQMVANGAIDMEKYEAHRNRK